MGDGAMTKTKWRDEDVDRHLHELSVDPVTPGAPQVSANLLARTRTRMGQGRPHTKTRVRFISVAAAALILLGTVPATMLAMGQPILGIRVSISNMDPVEWLRRGFSDWTASPGAPEFLSPEETANTAPFPIRVPTWLPDGYEAVSEPKGAYPNVHEAGRWTVSEDLAKFFVSQSFRSGDEYGLAVLQSVRPVPTRELTMAPGTEMLEVKGHPAFLKLDVAFAKADKENEARAKRGELPEIVDHKNRLEIWVQEPDGQITEITILSSLSPEVMIQVAESLFN